jgi:hypothetical protein
MRLFLTQTTYRSKNVIRVTFVISAYYIRGFMPVSWGASVSWPRTLSRITRRYIPEYITLHNYRCGNLNPALCPFQFAWGASNANLKCYCQLLYRFPLNISVRKTIDQALDDRGSFPYRVRNFSVFYHVWTSSENHRASYHTASDVSFPGFN